MERTIRYGLALLIAFAGACKLGDLVSTPPVARLAFAVQPTGGPAGQTLAPPVRVAALDDAGDTVRGYSGRITIDLGANPGGGLLTGARSANAVSGIATFSGLQIDQPASGYTLTASAAGLAATTSTAFDITPRPTRLVFSVQPQSTPEDAAIPAVRITALDASGNVVAAYHGNVTVSIGANPSGGTLTGTRTVAAANGVANFANLRIDKPGRGYTLVATATGLTSVTSAGFDVTQVPVALAFTMQPGTAFARQAITPPVEVTVLDADGNRVTDFTGPVTVALAPNLLGASLSGTLTVNAINGVATFADLSVDLPGSDYHLTAAFGGGAALATSAPFVVLP